VFVAVPGEDDLERPPELNAASLQVPVYGFATLGDTLVALTRDQLIWRNPRTRTWSLGPNLSGLLGRLRRFAADGPGFWVAGDRGVGFARLGARAAAAKEIFQRPPTISRWIEHSGGHGGRTGPLSPRRHSP
jgi:hypothetical protein